MESWCSRTLLQSNLERFEGRERRSPCAKGRLADVEGNRVCPGAAGATNWMSPTTIRKRNCSTLRRGSSVSVQHRAAGVRSGDAYYGSAYFPNDDAAPFTGALRAIDPNTENEMGMEASSPTWAGCFYRGWARLHG